MPNSEKSKNNKVSKYQIFKPLRVNREDLHEAPYNPRSIDDHSRKLLKKSVKGGLADAIIWNKRTGYIVGGHQRLSVLDELEGNKNYALDVLMIDVDEQTERELNIKLNNENMMGVYDADKLASMFINDHVQFANVGFSALDIRLSFDTPVVNMILGVENEEQEEVIKDIQEINKIKDARKRSKERANQKNETDFFKVVVFDNMESMNEFTKYFGFDDLNRYIDGERLKTAIGIGGDN